MRTLSFELYRKLVDYRLSQLRTISILLVIGRDPEQTGRFVRIQYYRRYGPFQYSVRRQGTGHLHFTRKLKGIFQHGPVYYIVLQFLDGSRRYGRQKRQTSRRRSYFKSERYRRNAGHTSGSRNGTVETRGLNYTHHKARSFTGWLPGKCRQAKTNNRSRLYGA